MKAFTLIAAAATVLSGVALAQAQSDGSALVRNPRIIVDYREPVHPIYGQFLDPDDARAAKEFNAFVKRYEQLSNIRRRLIERQLLEEFSQFLAPLKLPINLGLTTQQCNVVNAFYDPTASQIILCYEWVAHAVETAPKQTTAQGITRQDAIIGGIVGVLLHEAGHAVSNLLRLPVFSREEDTADQLAGFISLQFGRDIARTLIKGEAYSWHVRQGRSSAYWGAHSTALQRQHMYLCLAYGKDPEGFEEFVSKFGWLPKQRAENCANEYRQIEHAFRITVLPHLDLELMKKVQQRNWLRANDGKR